MPIDLAAEAVVAAVEAAAEVVGVTDPPKRGRFRRFLYWSLVALVSAFLVWVIFLA